MDADGREEEEEERERSRGPKEQSVKVRPWLKSDRLPSSHGTPTTEVSNTPAFAIAYNGCGTCGHVYS